MKQLFYLFAAGMVLLTFSSCANGKKIQEKPPIALERAFYTHWKTEGTESGSGFTLFIPGVPATQVKLDSVYFRGMRAKLQKSGADPSTYLAYFKLDSTKETAPDIIMHVDPKMEYGNQAPVIPEELPFELENDEAIVRYSVNENTKYFKIKGIQERPSDSGEIKKPENIRH